MRLVEQRELRRRAQKWFELPDQVAHYRQEASAGGTSFETMLLGALPRACSVVDLGCGAGRITLELLRRGHRPIGVDISRALLGEARELIGRQAGPAALVLMDGLRLPFPDGTFEAAVAFKLLGYIPSRSLRQRYLDEVHRILRPSGVLLLTYATAPPDALSSLAEDGSHMRAARQFTSLEVGDTFCDGAGFVHWFTSAALRTELVASSFEVVSIHEDDLGSGGVSTLGAMLRKPRD